MNYDFDADGTGVEGEDDTDQESAWLTNALHGRVQSGGVLDYSFYRSEETEGWLLLRRVATLENAEVVAEYPIDHDIDQMFRSAVASVWT